MRSRKGKGCPVGCCGRGREIGARGRPWGSTRAEPSSPGTGVKGGRSELEGGRGVAWEGRGVGCEHRGWKREIGAEWGHGVAQGVGASGATVRVLTEKGRIGTKG